jgi:hypothetical protein
MMIAQKQRILVEHLERDSPKYSISLIHSEFSAYLCAYLCVPLRLNFQSQFATILRKAALSKYNFLF